MDMLRLLKAECLKTKRTKLLLTHLLVPIAISGLFLAYYSYSPWDSHGKITAYFQGLACGLPMIIGLVCAMASEQEANAGHYQSMLVTTKLKIKAYLSKLVLLLMYSFGAIFMSVAIFSIGFRELLHELDFDYLFYSIAACIIFGSHIIFYILHLFVSLQFGKGASIGLGIVEALGCFVAYWFRGYYLAVFTVWMERSLCYFMDFSIGGYKFNMARGKYPD